MFRQWLCAFALFTSALVVSPTAVLATSPCPPHIQDRLKQLAETAIHRQCKMLEELEFCIAYANSGQPIDLVIQCLERVRKLQDRVSVTLQQRLDVANHFDCCPPPISLPQDPNDPLCR